MRRSQQESKLISVVGKMSHVARRKNRIDVATRGHDFLQKCRLGNRGFLLKCREIMSQKLRRMI